MTPDIKRQLKEKAEFSANGREFMAGAAAAWELATKVTEDFGPDDAFRYAMKMFPEEEDSDYRDQAEKDCRAGIEIGRRGLREAVEAEVKRERERIMTALGHAECSLDMRSAREIIESSESGE